MATVAIGMACPTAGVGTTVAMGRAAKAWTPGTAVKGYAYTASAIGTPATP